jgi:hypothetical protein
MIKQLNKSGHLDTGDTLSIFTNLRIVTYLLKAVIAEQKETAVSRQWLCKHLSKTTNSCDRGEEYLAYDVVTDA